MGEIIDLISAGENELPHPSTGTVKTGSSVMVKNVSNTIALVTESKWSAVSSFEEEACMLFHNLVDAITRCASTSPASSNLDEAVHNSSLSSTCVNKISQYDMVPSN